MLEHPLIGLIQRVVTPTELARGLSVGSAQDAHANVEQFIAEALLALDETVVSFQRGPTRKRWKWDSMKPLARMVVDGICLARNAESLRHVALRMVDERAGNSESRAS